MSKTTNEARSVAAQNAKANAIAASIIQEEAQRCAGAILSRLYATTPEVLFQGQFVRIVAHQGWRWSHQALDAATVGDHLSEFFSDYIYRLDEE